MSRLRDQVLALAGVTQYALYTHELAADGRERSERLDGALHAIYCTDPQDSLDVFGGVDRLRDGICLLQHQIGGRRDKPLDRATAMAGRYTGQILRLSGKLRSRPQNLELLRAAIERARLADVEQGTFILDQAYQETVSRLRPRLLVHGHPSYLKNPLIAQRVRTFLLAAVRCGILWRQSGGGVWRLLLQRRGLLTELRCLAQELPDSSTP